MLETENPNLDEAKIYVPKKEPVIHQVSPDIEVPKKGGIETEAKSTLRVEEPNEVIDRPRHETPTVSSYSTVTAKPAITIPIGIRKPNIGERVSMFIQEGIVDRLPQKPILAIYDFFERRRFKFPVTCEMEFAGEKIVITSETPNQRRLDEYMKTEELFMDWLSEVVSTNRGIVWNIGAAADGIPGILSSKKGARKVVFFEPDPENFDSLEKNIFNNIAAAESIKAVRIAVGSEDGTSTLRTAGVRGDAPQVVTEGSVSKTTLERTATKDIDVEASRMDTLANIYENPDIIIVDVEGSEKDVLIGMGELSPEHIFIEIHRNSANVNQDEILATLQDKGYQVIRGYVRGKETLIHLQHT